MITLENLKEYVDLAEKYETMYEKKIDNKEKEEQNEDVKKIIFSERYIKWLNDFTKKNGGFTENDYLYFNDKISDIDKENVNKLNVLYETINNYAKKNYIAETPWEYGSFYRIKYDDNGYKIGAIYGKGIMYFCYRIPINKEDYFIDFKNILINKKENKAIIFEKYLNDLSKEIVNAYKIGIPIEVIKTRVNNIVESINSLDVTEQEEKVLNKKK